MIKCEACRAFYHFFCNEFSKFTNTGARMLDSIYQKTLKVFCNRVFGVKMLAFCQIHATYVVMSVTKILKPLMVYLF